MAWLQVEFGTNSTSNWHKLHEAQPSAIWSSYEFY